MIVITGIQKDAVNDAWYLVVVTSYNRVGTFIPQNIIGQLNICRMNIFSYL